MGRKYQFATRRSSRWPDIVSKSLACPSTPPHRRASSEVQRTAARGTSQGQVSAPAAIRVRFLTSCTQSVPVLQPPNSNDSTWPGAMFQRSLSAHAHSPCSASKPAGRLPRLSRLRCRWCRAARPPPPRAAWHARPWVGAAAPRLWRSRRAMQRRSWPDRFQRRQWIWTSPFDGELMREPHFPSWQSLPYPCIAGTSGRGSPFR